MKNVRILQTVILMVIVVSVVSCSTSRRTTDRRYPNEEYPYPRVPDRQPYPDYPEYPTDRYPEYPSNDYPVYNDPNPNNLPPGQAKKIYGGKSARPYAPGQRKKYSNGDYGYRHRTFPLIIVRTRDMVIQRDGNNRYYYRHPDGVIYWRGYDNRYYLDERHLSTARYTQQEYDDWRYKGDRLGKVKDIFGRRQ